MNLDFSNAEVTIPIVIIVAMLCATTCGVADKCSDDGRYDLELKKACVYKTGNPECRR